MIATLRQRNFALLWFGGLISIAGDWMLFIALPIYIYKLTGSTLATSGMFMAGMLPRLLLGSVAGVFVDRWDRKRTMVITNLLLALGLLPLLLIRSPEWLWVAYVVAFVQSSIAQFFDPAEGALLPRLVGEKHLVAANSLNALNNNLARLIGPPLGGFAAGLFGLTGVALFDAASFLIAGTLIALINVNARPEPAPVTSAPAAAERAWLSVWREWLAGLRLIGRERPLRVGFAIMALTSLGEGAFGVLFVVFVNQVLGGGPLELGWLMAAQAVGGLLGGVLIGPLGGALSPARLIGLCGIAFGLIDLAIFNYPALLPGLAPALLLIFLVGVPGVGFSTGMTTLLQTATEDRYRGRILGALGTTSALLSLLGTVLAGSLGDILGVVTILNLQGIGYITAGLMALALLRGMAGPRRADAREPAGVLNDTI